MVVLLGCFGQEIFATEYVLPGLSIKLDIILNSDGAVINVEVSSIL